MLQVARRIMPPVACDILPGTRAGPKARSGGRSRRSEMGTRARYTTERVVYSHRDDPGGEASPRGPC